VTPREAVLERACVALATMVREEYPSHYTLVEIADIWGTWMGVTPEQIDALRELELEEVQS